MNNHVITLQLDDELYEYIKISAANLGLSLSAFVRMILLQKKKTNRDE